MTKKYTLNVLINEVSSLTPKEVASNFFEAISPRNGIYSRKNQVLAKFLGGKKNVISVLKGNTKATKALGSTPKARMIKALKLRKARKAFVKN